jgi:menaquinone-9 beta-reductase
MARAGHRVTILERNFDRHSFKRVCTHLIQNAAIPTLQRMGLLEPMLQAGAKPSILKIWFRDHWIPMSPNQPTDDHGPTWNLNLRREVLDPMVKQLALSTPGVEMRFGTSLESLIRTKGRVVGVCINHDGHRQAIQASLVVGADGRHSRTASLAKFPTREYANIRGGWGAYYRNVRFGNDSDTHFWLLEPDIAYAFPTDSGLTLLATITTPDKLKIWKKNIQGNHWEALQKLPGGTDFSQAERVSDFFGMMKAPGYYRKPDFQPGMTLIGDAALTTDFVWGDGCSNAFRSAEMLAQAIGPASYVQKPRDFDKAVVRYAKKHRSLYYAHLHNSVYSRREKLEWLRSQIFQAARTNERVRQLMFEVQTARRSNLSGTAKLIFLSLIERLSASMK